MARGQTAGDPLDGIVFGASGFVGGAILTEMQRAGMRVLGTYARRPAPGLAAFNLREPDLPALLAGRSFNGWAVIAGAITNMDACLTDPSTRDVNVTGTIRLLQQVAARGAVPIFLSTDYVFDGRRGNYRESDPATPIMAYGSQKLEVESYMRENLVDHLILRISHVYGTASQPRCYVSKMVQELKAGKILRCAVDQVFSPTYLPDVGSALRLAIESGLRGTFHVAPDERFSRFRIAEMLCERLGRDPAQVQPCHLSDLSFGDKRPQDTSLDGTAFRHATGIVFSSLAAISRQFG